MPNNTLTPPSNTQYPEISISFISQQAKEIKERLDNLPHPAKLDTMFVNIMKQINSLQHDMSDEMSIKLVRSFLVFRLAFDFFICKSCGV